MPTDRRPVPEARPLVRRARASEWPELRELRLRALRADPLAFGGTLAEELALPEARWVERADRGATSATSGNWVAEDRTGGLVGSSVLAEVDGEVHLFAMWVDPHHRRAGLGGRLLDAALAWGDHAFPGRVVRLEVNPRQASAVALYRSRGFRATGTRRPLGHQDGEWVEEMVRPPAPPAGERA